MLARGEHDILCMHEMYKHKGIMQHRYDTLPPNSLLMQPGNHLNCCSCFCLATANIIPVSKRTSSDRKNSFVTQKMPSLYFWSLPNRFHLISFNLMKPSRLTFHYVLLFCLYCSDGNRIRNPSCIKWIA